MKQIQLNHLQIELPKITSLLFAGSAYYIGFVDPYVRLSHQDKKEQLTHWSNLYSHSKTLMGSLAFLSSLFGLNAYRLTKEPLWLCGSAVIFSIIPFTFLAIMKTNQKLADNLKNYKADKKADEQISGRLSSWVTRHRVRVLLSIVGFGLFLAASSKSSATQLISNGATKLK